HVAGFKRAGLVLQPTANHKAIAGASVESPARTGDAEMAGDHIYDLLVRMAVRRANPSFLHAMLRQEQFVVIRPDGAREAWLRQTGAGVSSCYHDESGWSFSIFHCSSFLLPRNHALKGDTQAQLHLAHGLGAGNGSKGARRQWIGRCGSVGSIQVDHVE